MLARSAFPILHRSLLARQGDNHPYGYRDGPGAALASRPGTPSTSRSIGPAASLIVLLDLAPETFAASLVTAPAHGLPARLTLTTRFKRRNE
jgi:hypothetical protein